MATKKRLCKSQGKTVMLQYMNIVLRDCSRMIGEVEHMTEVLALHNRLAKNYAGPRCDCPACFAFIASSIDRKDFGTALNVSKETLSSIKNFFVQEIVNLKTGKRVRGEQTWKMTERILQQAD
jgi:hypothetical protein